MAAAVDPDLRPDVLGEPFTAETLPLADDEQGPAVATLVSRPADPGTTPRGAVLHLHGFADYFFQTQYAAWWAARGYAFHALDLRAYGRSWQPHQRWNYTSDLRTYDEEVAAAWSRVTERDGHDRVVLSAHSTGGLVGALWLDRVRPPELAGVVLNSPWLDLRGSALLRTVGTRVIDVVGARQPLRVIPRDVNGVYARSLHADHAGDHPFDLAWKPEASFPVHLGWLRAVRRAHAELHAGLDIAAPVLVLSSDRTGHTRELDATALSTDLVLDVEQIRRWSPALGRHVTYVAVPGAVHDVVLSQPEARARVYVELDRWTGAYLGTATGASA